MHGRYIDAAQIFEDTEVHLDTYTDAERARYGLYRGATLLALGYTNGAHYWLNYGSTLATESLSESERSTLLDALVPEKLGPRFSTKRTLRPLNGPQNVPKHVPSAPAATVQPTSVLMPRVPGKNSDHLP